MLETHSQVVALKSDTLPPYLASIGLNLQQIAIVMYGLFREIKILGKLTPGLDNAIHITKEKLLQMAKDPALDSDLDTLFNKVQRAKSWDVLFQKDNKEVPITAPDLWHNPAGTSPKSSKTKTTEEAKDNIEILDFTKFLMVCGINPGLIRKAMEEKSLLKGENKNEKLS